MRAKVAGSVGALAVVAVAWIAFSVAHPAAQPSGGDVAIDADDIGGVVKSAKGPEAGVWVIAETTDLPTKFAKMVVSDELGRFVIPDLPKANYMVWTRGYGLVDSPKVRATVGRLLSLKAVVAPNAKAAAEYYPALYWYALLKMPEANEFTGAGRAASGIEAGMRTQADWIRQIKTDGCITCHQIGDKATRELPKTLGKFDSSLQVWQRRLQSGQAGNNMMNNLNAFGANRALTMLSDWTDRIAKGELPSVPARPQGVERNVVVTLWDWADPKAYLHDEISTDKRNPTVNAYGLIYGSAEESTDYLPVLDPVHNRASQVKVPVRDPKTPITPGPFQPSPYWGPEAIWTSHTTVHNPMFDSTGRVWFTARIRPREDPAYCGEGSRHPSAALTPLTVSGRQLAVYDPQTKKVTLIDTCFGTHHLQFASDANHTLWTSSGGGGGVVGWLNTKVLEATHSEEQAQGWSALVLDTNGNGRRDPYVEPNQPVDPKKDTRIAGAFYGITISPADGSIWGSVLGLPGGVARLTPGSNPPATTLTEWYEVPWNNPRAPVQGFSPRGLDIDRDGVVWTVLGSGHMASFDRRKCRGSLNGPAATGQHCPEGWTLYELPGPHFKGLAGYGSAEASYYDWVDQFDTFGLGRNVPIATGNQSDALFALVNGKFVTLRVPYPIGFYAKGLDGRIDDPNAGWKGRGLWSTYATRTPFHAETGKGTTSKVVHFQLRPNPLSK